MVRLGHLSLAALPVLLASQSYGQCPFPKESYIVDPDYNLTTVSTSLSAPRGIAWDNQGHLLIVQQSKNLIALNFTDLVNPCSYQTIQVVNDSTLNHAVFLNANSTKLYASSSTNAWEWDYDSTTATVSNQRVVVTNMTNADHSTRTLLIPAKHQNLLIVSRGSDDNLDSESAVLSTGRAQVRIFDLDTVPAGGYNYSSSGTVFGWGLRNDVGLAVDENDMVWSVENSADNLMYTAEAAGSMPVDIHETNPAEELNFLGDPANPKGLFYGYPNCFTVWNGSTLPESDLSTGQQFTLSPNMTFNDTTCNTVSQQAAMTFHPHNAPLDIKFLLSSSGPCGNSTSTTGLDCALVGSAFVSFHGSWDSTSPAGYKVSRIPFTNTTAVNGTVSPSAPVNSQNGVVDIFSNVNVEQNCSPSSGKCFRPVGLAFDRYARLWVSSDATGELFMLSGRNGSSTASQSTGAASTTGLQRSALAAIVLLISAMLVL